MYNIFMCMYLYMYVHILEQSFSSVLNLSSVQNSGRSLLVNKPGS